MSILITSLPLFVLIIAVSLSLISVDETATVWGPILCNTVTASCNSDIVLIFMLLNNL